MIEIQQHTFQKTLHDVTHLNDISVEYLEQTIKQFPWFASAHQLLAKKYQLLHHQNFNEQLQHAALLSFNRAALFNLIEKEITPKKIIEPKKAEIIEVKDEVKTIAKVENIELPIITSEVKNELDVKQNEKQNILERDFEIKKINLTEISEFEPIEKEEIITPIITKVETQKPKIMATEMKAENEKLATPSSNNTKTETPKTFTSWLKKFNKGSNIGEEKVIEPKPSAKKSSEIIAKIEEGYEDVDDNEVDDLKVNLAELSTFSMQQHDEFVTETMAKIFEQQEKFDKAISTYEKLSLLKPEKSVFFASRIAEIKNKIKF